jgi:hypothetical protein
MTCILLLHYAISPRILYKNLAISSTFANMTLLRRITTFFLRFHRILLDYSIFSYISLSGITTKTHFTPDFTKETPEKSRIDTLLCARSSFAIRFAILTSYPAKQDSLDLKFHSLLVYL